MWWLLVHRKSFRVDDTTYFGLASSLTAHSRIAGGASSSPRATAEQLGVEPRRERRIVDPRRGGSEATLDLIRLHLSTGTAAWPRVATP